MKFEVWSDDNEHPITFDEPGPREAAEAWADGEDSGHDYAIASGRRDPVVSVRAPDGSLSRWTIEAEAVPVYRAAVAAALIALATP